MKNKVFLSVETSINRIFLVIYNKGELLEVKKNIETSIEVDLNNLLGKLFKKAQLEFKDLHFIMVSLGPGSFTGTRIGLSAAKAIALATGKKIYGYSNFETMYNQAIIDKKIIRNENINLLIRSSKYDFYHQKIYNNKFEGIQITNVKDIINLYNKDNYFIGNFKNIYNLKKYHICIPSKEAVLKTVKDLDKVKKKYTNKSLAPFYVKEHYAKKLNE